MISLAKEVTRYKEAATLMRQLNRMDPADVVLCETFPVRVRWAIKRLQPRLVRLEAQQRIRAAQMLSEKIKRSTVAYETGLPRRTIERISKEVRALERERMRQLLAIRPRLTPSI